MHLLGLSEAQCTAAKLLWLQRALIVSNLHGLPGQNTS
jgi:hypothetical protein